MTIRFFILQSHYRSLVDFSNESLLASETSLSKLLKAIQILKKIKPSTNSTINVDQLKNKCYEALDDDLNSPKLISYLFEGVNYIYSVNDGIEKLDSIDIESLKNLFDIFVFKILGLKSEKEFVDEEPFINNLIDASLNIRQIIKLNKDWSTSDKIRVELNKIGIIVKDKKDEVEWERE
jgi:cysteinyl-tRNA synthetase